MPSTSVFQAALFDRLGALDETTCHSLLTKPGQSELVQNVHSSTLSVLTKHTSLSDHCRIQCRQAYHVAQQGHYKQSLVLLEQLQRDVAGNLKLEQRVKAFASIIALRRAIKR